MRGRLKEMEALGNSRIWVTNSNNETNGIFRNWKPWPAGRKLPSKRCKWHTTKTSTCAMRLTSPSTASTGLTWNRLRPGTLRVVSDSSRSSARTWSVEMMNKKSVKLTTSSLSRRLKRSGPALFRTSRRRAAYCCISRVKRWVPAANNSDTIWNKSSQAQR